MTQTSEQQIHLIFKTHLDIGFTDHAKRVRQQYHEQFIPQAIATGAHFYAEDPANPKFIWTTGAWLIWDHLQTQSAEKVARLEDAIRKGLIAWHGLPFTSHTELMSPKMFRAALSFSRELDKRFGKTTIAAKMTDVPGHTLGMVPLMAEAGLRFLHLGVNTASPVPDVPPIFRWRAEDGSEIVVMYQNSYGATDFPAGPDLGLSFAHTNDNIGPQSVGQTVEALRELHHANPGALIKASTLDAFGQAMWERREDFPIIDKEIGDSWIHGAASDPVKLSQYKALERFYENLDQPTEERETFARRLAMVAEHTWGVDIKTYLRDDQAFDQAQFEHARKIDYRFQYAEQSWQEQRDYMHDALSDLSAEDRAAASQALAELVPIAPRAPRAGNQISDGGWMADLDPSTGDIARLVSPEGVEIAGSHGALFGYRHETYDWAELQRHLDSYLQHRQEWAILDHDKPGLQNAKTARTASFAPTHIGVDANAQVAIAAISRDEAAHVGIPARHDIAIRRISHKSVEVSLTLRDKPANRIPEAGFFAFTPAGAAAWSLRKMASWKDSAHIVRAGGGQLQAIEAARTTFDQIELTIEPIDSALVCPAGSDFIPFQPEIPDFSQGLRFNLYNNKWGTNFPMWWDGTVQFRFVLTLGGK
ncbi:DUF5054 domain-containing protein [Devosia sp. WQ 349]|uniref:DUF5054 domain-containing protein n=1 Tax=Devosia sp. WQ 349K1 TaxID=2800329 RepID=UPI0019053280|nr:DUF5054 domain-containing protein [Devosia sp. WQ 349K1]MBK1793206.1 DUF5054 domain-containing protein [Devosia sp. WQ 349K1]